MAANIFFSYDHDYQQQVWALLGLTVSLQNEGHSFAVYLGPLSPTRESGRVEVTA